MQIYSFRERHLTNQSHRMSSFVVFVLIFFFVSSSECGVFGNFKTGIEAAGKWFGFGNGSGIAKLVTESFGKNRNEKQEENSKNIFSAFFRILGFDARKIGAIAVNAIIFIAQMISTSFSRPPPPQITSARISGTPFDWLMNNSKVPDLLDVSLSEELPEMAIDYIKERSLDEQTGCIQLLLCKTIPFVKGMQRAVTSEKEERAFGSDVLYEYLPDVEEVAGYGDECEKKHPYCFFVE